jgi:hypothetical protein
MSDDFLSVFEQSAVSFQRSAFSDQLSAVSFQRSAFSDQRSGFSIDRPVKALA